MFKILEKEVLNSQTKKLIISAPMVARKARAGQFIILRIDERGERIPLTISDYDAQAGTVTIVFQEVGATTKRLGALEAGDSLLNFAGPLGTASELNDFKKVCVIGGGLGAAIAYPQAKQLSNDGAVVDVVTGFRNKDLIILEDEMRGVCRNLHVATDDGSNGNKGFVTSILEKLITGGESYDAVIAIGPLVMMRAVCELTKKYGIKTIVSMNPIMIDGTGMCGGCRIVVDGEIKFACVDGPDFDGHKVDFDVAMSRLAMYREWESKAHEHECKLLNQAKGMVI